MHGLRLSLLANLAGSVWSALIGFAVVPVYLDLLGIEAYGLIGLYLTLQSILGILDLGLSATINRELARSAHLPAGAGTPAATQDLVRTLEVACWTIAGSIAIVGVVAASFAATAWIRAEHLPPATVREAVMMMALLAAIQWPLGFYYGGLRGLDRPGLVNAIQIITTTAAAGGAVLVLRLYAPTITAFWTWQIFVAAVRIVAVRFLLWRHVPPAERPARVSLAGTRHVWRFAAGMSGITVTAILVWNLDKIVLSWLLPLNLLGYYLLAAQVAGVLSFAVTPVFNTVFPTFSALVVRGDRQALAHTYHQMTQVMAVLVLPLAGVLIMFAEPLIALWTGAPITAKEAAPPLRFLVAGMALNAIMNLPYALQLGVGWTRLGLQINVTMLCGLVPTLWLATRTYGATGAAAAWFGLNAIYMAVGAALTHRRVLPGETGTWFGRDVVWPGLVAIGLIAGLRYVVEPASSRVVQAGQIAGVLLIAMSAAVLAATHVRAAVFRQIGRLALP